MPKAESKPTLKVELTYMKPNGAHHGDGDYHTAETDIVGVWIEVRVMRDQGKLPNLEGAGDNWYVWISVPDHPHNQPRLLTLLPGGDGVSFGSHSSGNIINTGGIGGDFVGGDLVKRGEASKVITRKRTRQW